MVGLHKNRLTTDAVREIKNTFSRYLSILVLSALAVAFLAGLRTTAPDMQYTADTYYDRKNLMDGYVISTLGLTDEDLTALAAADGIEDVEGIWTVDAIARDAIVSVRSLPRRMNLLEVVEGRLPEAADECVTERLLLVELGLSLGDRLELALGEDNEGDLEHLSYTIVGVAESPLYVGTDRGTSSLGGGSVDGFVYIPEENFHYDYYTTAYFTGRDLQTLNSYGDEYEERLDALVDSLDGLADERAALRYASVVGDAQEEIDDAQAELDDAAQKLADARADADRELADAREELADARGELNDGWKEYYEGIDTYHQEIADAEAELADAHQELLDAEAELADGKQKYADGMKEYQDALAEYEDGVREYEDGKTAYADGLKKYEDGQRAYEDGRRELASGSAELASGRRQYEAGLAQYEQGMAQLNTGKAQLEAQRGEYQTAKDGLPLLASGKEQLEAGLQGLDYTIAGLEAQLEALQTASPSNAQMIDQTKTAIEYAKQQQTTAQSALDGLNSQIAAAQAGIQTFEATEKQINDGYAEAARNKTQLDSAASQLDAAGAEIRSGQEQLRSASQELDDAKKELDDSKLELADAEKELADGRTELDDAWQELEDARVEIEDGERELTDGWAEYHDGVAELEDARVDGKKELDDALTELQDGERQYIRGLAEYSDGKREADKEIADAQQELDDAQAELDEARAELADIDECEWYVLGRNTNVGFESYGQDSDRIGNLANIFPVIFFLVAALACLTTMTRMVEEQRTQIGALKAMGFSRLAISQKYIGYALSASLLGGVLGLTLGGTLIPAVIANAFQIMYHIPALRFKNQMGTYLVSVAAAVLCTTGAALWACLSTLVDTPANLMRPRAPKPGKRVLLEYIRPLWSRLSFTWKVTMRNLFRYKRRFWMTVIGIGGCTALIVTGFGLHDSIFSILNRQFDEVSLYDASAGLDAEAEPEELAEAEAYLSGNENIESFLFTSESMAEASTTGAAYDVNLFAIENMDEFTQFIDLRHRLDDEAVALPDDGVLISEKLSELLDVRVGDSITLKKDDVRVTAVVSDIVENYVRHYIYLSEAVYEGLFSEAPEENVALIRYGSDISQAQSDQVSVDMMAMDAVTSYSYIATIRDTFTDSMNAIDYAVVIIILAAAALAFVVLYNLTNINITERTRELATLKVLGFYDRETTAYVYRENVFLTFFGILLGLVMGRFLHSWLVLTVEVNIVMFGRTAPPYAYVLAAVLTVIFSVIVNIAAHFKLKKVDMVESLKTVE